MNDEFKTLVADALQSIIEALEVMGEREDYAQESRFSEARAKVDAVSNLVSR